MKHSLRTQLMASHLALVALMSLVMVGAVVNFFRLGRSIERILEDNYKSVRAAQTMKEALERQDSAATFFLAGQAEKARKQYRENQPLFEQAYGVEASNITETGEQPVADSIGKDYGVYKLRIEKLLFAKPGMPEGEARRFYFSQLEPLFTQIKDEAQQVLDINQKAIERADARARSEARHGALIGLVMTLTALGLAVTFAKRAISASLTPLLALTQEAQQIGAGHLDRRIELHRTDEVGSLATAFNEMAAKLRDARREQQQRLHRAQKMSDAALESLYDPVIVTDAGGVVVHLNRAAAGLFGQAQSVAGLPINRVVSEQRIVEAIDRAIRQEHVSAEEDESGLVQLETGGGKRTYRLRATPMREEDETLLGAALVLEDVTHLRELDRLKSEFISVASHELRTPVTSLMLSAQILEEGTAGELTEEQQEVVRAQREDLTRLESLLRDLLDLTKLEAGAIPPRFEWVSPGELVEDATQGVAAQAAAKGVRLESHSAAKAAVRADRAQIERVLTNLLNNAIRHTEARGHVEVEALDDGDKVKFRVKDNGGGIPPEYREKIFQRFAQVPGATRGGAGLGLPISQAIVQAHGGEIAVESEVGRGSVFEFELEKAGA